MKLVNDINVYHFGSSTTDPGNLVYEPQPGPQVPSNTDIPLGPTATFSLRYRENSAPGALHAYPEFVANELGMHFVKGSQLIRP